MKKRRTWRYVCDFCSKGYSKEKYCLEHEKRCIKNPSRVCEMCEQYNLGHRTPEEMLMAMKVASRLAGRRYFEIDQLRNISHGCPLCMLSVVVLDNKNRGLNRFSEDAFSIDYAAERDRFSQECMKEWRRLYAPLF